MLVVLSLCLCSCRCLCRTLQWIYLFCLLFYLVLMLMLMSLVKTRLKLLTAKKCDFNRQFYRIRTCLFFFKFYNNDGNQKLKAWSFQQRKNFFCMLNIQRPREHQNLITFVSVHPLKSCLAILFQLFYNRVVNSCSYYILGLSLWKSLV